ncbi:hypothetical protein A3J33_02280 [candidate division WWE3 bacterium RIFCSPLOWO2_02_FULL_53_10]|uniref:Uncharacterized protein n=2 Tax=Katanobacteria TaxID=422282 RepID=A0A1F4WBL5_UNCKA|nr:MAG: hypothetical protein A2890_00600 [candidate division WWE3 bacterium RIFCSPLOWO2_01_FULL_53_14]OGC66718.1 MAG: hypothetical protein A3J33_02280 [candidate division WWE3 bacterium RIFCSPLOWO2_02_FULL_53_10]
MKVFACEKKCASAFQDQLYGRGMRAHTLGVSKAVCTVCGHETPFAGKSAKAKGSRVRKEEVSFLNPVTEAKPASKQELRAKPAKQGRQLGRAR